MKTKVQVSVVIPAFNEEKYIRQCLESLVDQKTNLNYEVIVVDNNSQDSTVNIAQTFKDELNMTIIHEKKQGRGTARARGFQEAKGEIILSTDADAIVYPGWIETLVSGLGHGVVATTTSCKVNDLSFLKNTVFNFLQPMVMIFYKLIIGHFWLSGFSFAILKKAYEKAGGFNSHLQAQEDTELGFKVAKIGKIKFINTPVIFSGRRFKNGFLSGLFVYIKIFTEAFILKKQDVYLSNVR